MSCVSLQQDQGRHSKQSQISGNFNLNIGNTRKKRLSEKLLNIKENVSYNGGAMAFIPSDDIWEKFDLAGNCVNDDDFDIEAIMDDNDAFPDLENFAQDFDISDVKSLDEPFAVKDEQGDFFIKEVESDFFVKEVNDDDSSCDFLSDLNLPTLDLSAFEPETLKSDCMWSSTLNHMVEAQQQQTKGRKRDFSLTLSECNEGLMAIKDIEMLGSTPPTFMGGNLLAGSSLNAYIETPLTTSASESDTESTSTDEEIDVVSSDDNDGYRRHLVQQQQQHHYHRSQAINSSKKIAHIEPGRSLLLSRNRSPKPVPQQHDAASNASSHCQQTFIDHSYFLVRPPSPQQSPGLIQGMLTPTESSDDDESINTQFISSTGNIDKRKIAQAVQSLIKNNKQSLLNCANKRTATPDNIKFKFRMKFKSSGQQHSLLTVNNRHHMRRKSASNNSHCPPQSASKSPEPVSILSNSPKMSSASAPASPSKSHSSSLRNSSHHNIKSSRSSNNSSSSSSARSSPNNQEQKCREIRDLHNSMERQRRVDLRKNFDQLKSVVPELADTEKASKLNILNKASDYCKLLSTLDTKLRKDVDKESARNALLRKKLSALQSQFSSGVRLSSGRVSLVHARR